MVDKAAGREDRPAGKRSAFTRTTGKTAPGTENEHEFRKVMEENIPVRKGTDPRKVTPPQTLPGNEPLNPPAVTNAVKEAAKESPDLRTKALAQDTGTTAPETKEGEYRDPDSVGPNPDVEAYPNQKPNAARAFGYKPVGLIEGNAHQVYPEAHLGTTPTDPDIREADDKSTEDQRTQGIARRTVMDRTALTTKEPLDMRMRTDRFARRAEEFQTPVPPTPQPVPKFKGGLTRLGTDKSYKVRADQLGSEWWIRKYNAAPTIVIEGTVKDIFGAEYGDRALYGHYLFIEYNNRRNSMPKGHPIRLDDRQIYVGNVNGRRELVHAFEVETA